MATGALRSDLRAHTRWLAGALRSALRVHTRWPAGALRSALRAHTRSFETGTCARFEARSAVTIRLIRRVGTAAARLPLRIPTVGGGAAVAPATGTAVDCLDDGEVVILVLRPSLWHIPLSAAGTVGAIALAILVLAWMSRFPVVPWTDLQAATLGALAMGARLAFDFIDWSMRLYVLTDRRLMRRSVFLGGVPRAVTREMPLRLIQHVGVYATRRDRALSIGTMVVSGIPESPPRGRTPRGSEGGGGSAEDDGRELIWEHIPQAYEVQRLVRQTIDRYR